jgi:transcriptional regulator with XRE-family HTH domain
MGLHEMGDIMRKAREARQETQDELAFRSGVSQGWISQVELGHVAHPSAQKVRMVATALGITDVRVLFAAQFDIPFEGSIVAATTEPPNDPVVLANQIAALTTRLTEMATKIRSPERPLRKAEEG